jgi:PKD repeat protein
MTLSPTKRIMELIMKNYLTNISLRELFPNFLLAGLALFLFSSNLFAASANLAWNASTSSNVGGYKISYGQTSGNYASTIDVGNKTTYAVPGLQEGSKYYFAVKAYDSTKTVESGYSNETNFTVPATTAALTADFTVSKTSGVASLAVDFTPVTTGTITSWKWDFPGSQTPSVTNTTAKVTTATYATAGSYNVSLTVTGSSGSVTKSYPNLITVTAPTTSTGTGTTTPTTSTGTGTTTTSNNGLVAAYGFEETSGTTVNDASGNSNIGTIKEAVRINTGKYGKALQFDGINDWVTVNDSATLDLTNAMTLEAWVYPQSLTNGGTVLLKEKSGGAVYNLYAYETSDLPVSSFNDGSYRVISGTSKLPVNQWTHLVATYDGQYQRLYVNGTQIAQRAQTGLIQQGGILRIGGNSVWGEYFKGYIDEIRVYNRALTATEVKNNMTTPTSSASASTTTQYVIGDQTVEPKLDYNGQGVAQAFKTTPQKSSTVTALQVYVDATSKATELVAGIYKDNYGHPGALVAQGKLATLKPGAWNPVPIPAASVTAGQPYWLAILGSKGNLIFRDQLKSGTAVLEITNTNTLTSLPSLWPASYAAKDGPISVYGTGY